MRATRLVRNSVIVQRETPQPIQLQPRFCAFSSVAIDLILSEGDSWLGPQFTINSSLMRRITVSTEIHSYII